MVRKIGLAAGSAAVVALLSGCMSGVTGTPSTSSEATPNGPEAATPGGSIGKSGSSCQELPVSFDIAEGWEAEAVAAGTHSYGNVEAACEVDAKPAGNLGYIRVWVGSQDETARAALTSFVEGQDGTKASYTEVEAGSGAGVEVTFETSVEVDGEELERDRERAFAVQAGEKHIVVALDAFDHEEFQAMLPAYTLAMRSMSATGN